MFGDAFECRHAASVGCNRCRSRDSRRLFHPCAPLPSLPSLFLLLGVLAWVTVNFLTGKTLLVFFATLVFVVSGLISEAAVHTEAPAGKDSCLLPEVMSLSHPS